MATEREHVRWKAEADFFDQVAAREMQNLLPIDVLVLRRYGARSPRRRFNKEFRFRVMGDLRGKEVLDLGCGDGSHSVLLAKFGARVTGIDISAKSIELAKLRAEINSVKDSVQFICSPLETAELPVNSFDLIWGDAILHHVIDNLAITLERLTRWAKPGSLMLFTEPVNFNKTLRRLRLRLPITTDATPDERPLEPHEIAIVRRHLADFQICFFSLLGRLNRFIMIDSNYEHSSLTRRALVNAIACLDYFLLAIPGIRNLGGVAVFYGHVSESKSETLGLTPVKQ